MSGDDKDQDNSADQETDFQPLSGYDKLGLFALLVLLGAIWGDAYLVSRSHDYHQGVQSIAGVRPHLFAVFVLSGTVALIWGVRDALDKQRRDGGRLKIGLGRRWFGGVLLLGILYFVAYSFFR